LIPIFVTPRDVPARGIRLSIMSRTGLQTGSRSYSDPRLTPRAKARTLCASPRPHTWLWLSSLAEITALLWKTPPNAFATCLRHGVQDSTSPLVGCRHSVCGNYVIYSLCVHRIRRVALATLWIPTRWWVPMRAHIYVPVELDRREKEKTLA